MVQRRATKTARSNLLSDSHDCEKLPSRGAVVMELCCRDILGKGEGSRGKEDLIVNSVCAARVD